MHARCFRVLFFPDPALCSPKRFCLKALSFPSRLADRTALAAMTAEGESHVRLRKTASELGVLNPTLRSVCEEILWVFSGHVLDRGEHDRRSDSSHDRG